MKIKFKKKWQAKLYGKLIWLKTVLTTRDIIFHKYGLILLLPDKVWSINQILITDKKRKK